MKTEALKTGGQGRHNQISYFTIKISAISPHLKWKGGGTFSTKTAINCTRKSSFYTRTLCFFQTTQLQDAVIAEIQTTNPGVRQQITCREVLSVPPRQHTFNQSHRACVFNTPHIQSRRNSAKSFGQIHTLKNKSMYRKETWLYRYTLRGHENRIARPFYSSFH